MDASATLEGVRLVPVVVIDDAAFAVTLAETLLAAGLTTMEVTLRTPAALPAITAVAQAVPGMVIGAGSIRTADQVEDAARAGARFLVSPGSTQRLLTATSAARLPLVPGAVTATEIMHLADAGFSLVKFFPAERSGGVATLKALSDPLPAMRFFPTGGITAALAVDYLATPCVSCIGGSWFVPRGLIASKDTSAIAALCAQAMVLPGA